MAEKKIDTLSNIAVPCTSIADIYIKKIIFEGDASDKKRPISFLCSFEKTNQTFRVVTWDNSLLPLIKESCDNKNICTITFSTTEYRDGLSHKLLNFTKNEKISSHINEKDEDKSPTKYNKELYQQLINQVSDPDFVAILNLLIINNDNFFKWPAARNIHHAFEGGLAKHTYNVAANAINLSISYSGEIPLDYSLLTTGALLHDIGKLKEYTISGGITQLGQMMSHLVLGVEMINDACDQLNLNKYDPKFIKLKHIIVSHHNKLEFGSPNMPVLPEAYMVAYSDANDASIEAICEKLDELNTDEVSSSLAALDGGRIMKLY